MLVQQNILKKASEFGCYVIQMHNLSSVRVNLICVSIVVLLCFQEPLARYSRGAELLIYSNIAVLVISVRDVSSFSSLACILHFFRELLFECALLIFGSVLKEIIHPFQISKYALDTVLHPWNLLNSSKVNLY